MMRSLCACGLAVERKQIARSAVVRVENGRVPVGSTVSSVGCWAACTHMVFLPEATTLRR